MVTWTKIVMTNFHLLRPMWLLMIIPALLFFIKLWRQRPKLHAWEKICDPHLLAHLEFKKGAAQQQRSLLFLLLGLFFMILALAGPAWYKYPVGTYKQAQAYVLILDMSEEMLTADLSPNRLERAKFKLLDLFSRRNLGQFGLVVFTAEPFIASPLTDDGQTISSLLTALTPDVMPVSGQRLDKALIEGSQLIKSAGYQAGQILVLTATPPSISASKVATDLAKKGIFSSIMPMLANKEINPLFQHFAQAGRGKMLLYSTDSADLLQWIKDTSQGQFILDNKNNIPLWRDEGRWLLIPALILLLPVFRRAWLQKVFV